MEGLVNMLGSWQKRKSGYMNPFFGLRTHVVELNLGFAYVSVSVLGV